jgi:hypothetical protein
LQKQDDEMKDENMDSESDDDDYQASNHSSGSEPEMSE